MKRNLALFVLSLSLPALLWAAEPKGKPAARPEARSAPSKREKRKDEPYRIAFKPGSVALTAAGDKLLTKVLQTLAAFPLYRVDVQAFAAKTDKEPESLARRRAEKLRERIVSWKPPKASVIGMPLNPVSPELLDVSHSVSPKPRDAELRLVPLEDPEPRPAGQPVP